MGSSWKKYIRDKVHAAVEEAWNSGHRVFRERCKAAIKEALIAKHVLDDATLRPLWKQNLRQATMEYFSSVEFTRELSAIRVKKRVPLNSASENTNVDNAAICAGTKRHPILVADSTDSEADPLVVSEETVENVPKKMKTDRVPSIPKVKTEHHSSLTNTDDSTTNSTGRQTKLVRVYQLDLDGKCKIGSDKDVMVPIQISTIFALLSIIQAEYSISSEDIDRTYRLIGRLGSENRAHLFDSDRHVQQWRNENLQKAIVSLWIGMDVPGTSIIQDCKHAVDTGSWYRRSGPKLSFGSKEQSATETRYAIRNVSQTTPSNRPQRGIRDASQDASWSAPQPMATGAPESSRALSGSPREPRAMRSAVPGELSPRELPQAKPCVSTYRTQSAWVAVFGDQAAKHSRGHIHDLQQDPRRHISRGQDHIPTRSRPFACQGYRDQRLSRQKFYSIPIE